MLTVRPNAHTAALAAVVLAMWYAGAAQQNGGAYLLAFLTGSVVMVSWLHARVNLRGLVLKAGTVRTAQQGERLRLPLTLTAGDGPIPCGVEITAPGADETVFIESLSVDHPTQVELRLPAAEPGRHGGLTVIARSRYPLGFFTVERVIEVSREHLVHPRAAGVLPLPPAVQTVRERAGDTGPGEHGQAGAGDDFAGVREWQAGDSLRQVDWKAVARGRPMMVKLWNGAADGAIWLEWEAWPLPEEARTAQFAAWIDQGETQGVRYGMRLPGVVSGPGHGPGHRRQCLDALALHSSATGLQSKDKALPLRAARAPTRECSAPAPRQLVKMAALSLGLAALPVTGDVPLAGVIVFYLALAIQWYRQWKGLGPCTQAWRLLLISAGVAGTWFQGHSLLGLEPGVAIMLSVTAGKVLEVRTARELQIVLLLGWFLCLCALTLDQALGHSLYVLAVFALITATMVRFRRGAAGLGTPLKASGALLVQALPFVVLLFLFFPRGTGGMVMRLSRQFKHRTGISSSLDPGSVAEVARSTELAFRAAFVEGNVPDLADRYWRCLVLWDCKGLKWQRGLVRSPQTLARSAFDGELHQRILLEPHGDTWLPALDTPTHVMSNVADHSLTDADHTLRSRSEVTSLRRYDVGSRTQGALEKTLPSALRKAALQVPELSPEVKALAASFKAGGAADVQVANNAISYFRKQGFRYTLEPEKYGEHALDEFLFQRRLGFCEHFAAAFATLMRECGVPARVVIGYLGGEDSTKGGIHVIVRQSDAHAWCELWYEGKGWTRVDPTAALAPGRLNSDLRTYLEGGLDSAFVRNRDTWWGRAINETQLFWDGVNYQWYSHVVQFDEDDQDSLFNTWHLMSYRAPTLVGGGLALILTPMALVWLWLRRKTRHPDPAVRAWRAFCEKLARAGVARAANEAPESYARRAALALPGMAAEIERIGDLYVRLRYAGDQAALGELKRNIRALSQR